MSGQLPFSPELTIPNLSADARYVATPLVDVDVGGIIELM